MKVIIHIKTGDFEFLEIQDEVSSVEEAIESHNRAVSSYKAFDEGLDPKAWREALDSYITLGTITSDQGERMNKAQKWMIHELDKSSERVNRNNK